MAPLAAPKLGQARSSLRNRLVAADVAAPPSSRGRCRRRRRSLFSILPRDPSSLVGASWARSWRSEPADPWDVCGSWLVHFWLGRCCAVLACVAVLAPCSSLPAKLPRLAESRDATHPLARKAVMFRSIQPASKWAKAFSQLRPTFSASVATLQLGLMQPPCVQQAAHIRLSFLGSTASPLPCPCCSSRLSEGLNRPVQAHARAAVALRAFISASSSGSSALRARPQRALISLVLRVSHFGFSCPLLSCVLRGASSS